MAIVGFNFIKFNAERKSVKKAGSIDISHNISVKEVEKTQLSLGGNKTDVLKIEFDFMVFYNKSELGNVEIAGDVIYTDTKEIIDETFKAWEADKKLTAMVNEQVFKFIYNKSIVKSLELAESLNLPSPVPLPKVSFGKKEN